MDSQSKGGLNTTTSIYLGGLRETRFFPHSGRTAGVGQASALPARYYSVCPPEKPQTSLALHVGRRAGRRWSGFLKLTVHRKAPR